VPSGAFSAPHSSFVCSREEFEFKFEDKLISHNRGKTYFRLRNQNLAACDPIMPGVLFVICPSFLKFVFFIRLLGFSQRL
jgi:hypothetical protein